MISNTTEGLFIVYSNIFLQKKIVFSSCKEFYIDLWSFQLPNKCPFWLNFYGKFCCFFKCSLNFRDPALQSELIKLGYTNFVKFRLQSMTFKIERAFTKIYKICFCLHFANSYLKIIFYTLFPKHEGKNCSIYIQKIQEKILLNVYFIYR